MKQRYEIILAGSGGQGIVLGARILASAAILEGKNATQTQSILGDSQRGGLVTSDIIMDAEEIVFQQVEKPDVIVALGDVSIKRFGKTQASQLFLYEKGLADLGERSDLHAVPFAELATARGLASNMIALGMIVAMVKPVSLESMEKAVQQGFSAASAPRNLEGVHYGVELAAELFGKRVQTV